ncbi:MAG: class I SAM-dependent methyltransferase [Candidatus Sulfobium sp.]|jgi:2-polyprenyl-3-methyl-5-hydroxy-6-metoxy-1,4-benzoquinol methylase
MSEVLTIITAVSPSYRYSSELMLCMRMFRKALPEDSLLLVNESTQPGSFRKFVKDHFSRLSPYILIVKEPALLMGKDTVKTLRDFLDANPDIDCVLPSDIRGYRSTRVADYYTLKGFERFSSSLRDQSSTSSPYDGRDQWMFLIRQERLAAVDIPEDPMDIPKILPGEKTCISLNSYIHPFIDYYHEDRSDVLHLVPKDVQSFLDIGCARGNFGASVKRETGCRVVGVETNPHEAQFAEKNLDSVIVGDVLAVDIGETFDCVACLDVVEHFADPEPLLKKVRCLLNEEGHFLMAVPNVGHWSVIEDLMEGRWDYIPAGILTVSHLRFFTKAAIKSLLEDMGFTIVTMGGQPTRLPAYADDLSSLMEQFDIEVDKQNLSFLSYYILAKK